MGKKKSPIQLSQCMIVKNEEQNIRKALSWGKDFVCEQIVVDTGSTDKTVSIAKEMGAKVVTFPWIDDFSAAKNFAIQQAKGNWIALLDADEYFPDQDAKKLLDLLERVHSDSRFDLIRTRWVHLDDDNKIISVSCQDRVFRNKPEIRYRYRVHEELYSDLKTLGCYDAQDQLMILHTGYSKENKKGAGKGMRNARLLLKDLEEHPEDPMRIMYLGDAYAIADEKEKALDCYRKVMRKYETGNHRLTQEEEVALLRSGLQLMTLRSVEPAEAIEEEYFRICRCLREHGMGAHPDIDYFLALWYLKAGNAEKAGAHFEESIRKAEHYKGLEVVRLNANMELAAKTIALAAAESGELQKAVRFAVTALRVNKYSPEPLKILLDAFLTEYKSGAIEPYWKMLSQIYDSRNLKDLLFLHKIAGETGFFALQERIRKQMPQDAEEYLREHEKKGIHRGNEAE